MVSGRELVILRLGEPAKEVMKRALLPDDDLHKAVRQKTGNDNFLEIRHAIFERDGKITVIPIKPKWTIEFLCLHTFSTAQALG